ncbi:WD40-repeat-containing domain protein [Mycena galericulata]|nr:WD40-repeat-containing domain protein [Mycena galericulata]
MPYSLHRTLTPGCLRKAGPINAVLFFDEGTRLASGGDDQALRIWDVQSGDCQQEVMNPAWGQITNLNLMADGTGKTLGIFIGTGRGVVSVYPWHDRTQLFNRQGGTTTQVFPDTPVESQVFDSLKSRFAVASHMGKVNMYTLEGERKLVQIWSFNIGSSIPRSLVFAGNDNETLTLYTLMTGHVYCYDSRTGKPNAKPQRLRGGVGFVTVSPDGRKAVHNLTTDRYDLYHSNPSTTPISIPPTGRTRKIKGASFAEDGLTLVSGGDSGAVYIYNIAEQETEQELSHQDFSTVCALNTCTTKDYHLIASGSGLSPALIYIWGKPTERKEAEDADLELERQRSNVQAQQEAAAMAQAAKKAELLKAEKAMKQAMLRKLARDVNRMNTVNVLLSCLLGVVMLALFVDWLKPELRASFQGK